jgi:hypothetical protein
LRTEAQHSRATRVKDVWQVARPFRGQRWGDPLGPASPRRSHRLDRGRGQALQIVSPIVQFVSNRVPARAVTSIFLNGAGNNQDD